MRSTIWFFGHKMHVFPRQIGVCLPFHNGSEIEKRMIGVRYSKRERHKKNLSRSTFWFSVDITLYLEHRFRRREVAAKEMP